MTREWEIDQRIRAIIGLAARGEASEVQMLEMHHLSMDRARLMTPDFGRSINRRARSAGIKVMEAE